MSLEAKLLDYISHPKVDYYNFLLAEEYLKLGQTAAALSFYLRTAEFSSNDDLAYEALIKAGRCLGAQSRRYHSERGIYLHAVALNPTRPEAYLSLSLLYERNKEWAESYANACIAHTFLHNARPAKTDLGFKEYSAIFQKAVTSFWIGRGVECQELLYKLASDYHLSEPYASCVLNNIKTLNLVNHRHLIYNKGSNELLFKFPGYEKIERNYSQVLQDIFVLTMLEGKEHGFFLEIGSGDAYYGSNTALLEKVFKWKGISIDLNSPNNFNEHRSSVVIKRDATTIDYKKTLSNAGIKPGGVVDYLQLDCEPAETTYQVLLKIPFDDYKFGVITYEHDTYISGPEYRDLSRKYLRNLGYVLVFSNVAPDNLCAFEDWWVHPSVVNLELSNTGAEIVNVDSKPKNPTKYLLKTSL